MCLILCSNPDVCIAVVCPFRYRSGALATKSEYRIDDTTANSSTSTETFASQYMDAGMEREKGTPNPPAAEWATCQEVSESGYEVRENERTVLPNLPNLPFFLSCPSSGCKPTELTGTVLSMGFICCGGGLLP